MRPVLAAVIWIVLIGGLTLYMNTREAVKQPEGYRVSQASGTYSLELTTTFALEPDPFALRTAAEAPDALVLKLNGKELLRIADKVEAGRSIRIDPVPEVHDGANELYVEASPPVDSALRSYAIRIQLMGTHHEVLDRTIWSEHGMKIAASVPFRIEQQPRKEEHGHGR